MPKPTIAPITIPGATRTELARWRATAKLQGIKLADWIRQCCNAGAAGDEVVLVQQDRM